MKTLTSVLIVLLAFVSHLSAQKFEGTVTMNNSLYGGMTTSFYIQGDRAAMVSHSKETEPGSRTVIDRVTGDYHVISQMQVVKYNLSDPQFAALPGQNATAEVTNTGEFKTIDGYQCEKVLVNQGGRSAELWVAASLANLDIASFMIPRSLRREGRFLHVEGVTGFPLEINGTDDRSGQPFTIKNTVRVGKVDSEKLTIPAVASTIEINSLIEDIEDAGGDREKLKQVKENLNQNNQN